VPAAVPSSDPSRYNRTCCGCGQVSRGISGNRLDGRTAARKFSIGGLYVCAGGFHILKIDKKFDLE